MAGKHKAYLSLKEIDRESRMFSSSACSLATCDFAENVSYMLVFVVLIVFVKASEIWSNVYFFSVTRAWASKRFFSKANSG